MGGMFDIQADHNGLTIIGCVTKKLVDTILHLIQTAKKNQATRNR